MVETLSERVGREADLCRERAFNSSIAPTWLGLEAMLKALAAENAALQLRAEEHLAIAGKFETERDAAIRERDALRDEWNEIAAGITTEIPDVGALWPMVAEVSGSLSAVRVYFKNEAAAHKVTKDERDAALARVRRLEETMIGIEECWNGAAESAVNAAEEMRYRAQNALADTAPAGGEGGA